MEPICEGATGAAVEDIQDRLRRIGYDIKQSECDSHLFGSSTANAVTRFRFDQNLDLGSEVDAVCWAALVDESYTLGDRTLYLRLPNFHGKDVRDLQTRLNILGFSCGDPDGYYGAYTEAAVRQFQENVGLMADGMAFQDTFDAIERLHHVWAGKPADGPHPMGGMSFARAAHVLEEANFAITGEDPISRHVAARLCNLASATTEQSGLVLVETAQDEQAQLRTLFTITTAPLPRRSTKKANVEVDDPSTLPQRIRNAYESSKRSKASIRLQLPIKSSEAEGSFTMGDAQTLAITLLDAICAAFAE